MTRPPPPAWARWVVAAILGWDFLQLGGLALAGALFGWESPSPWAFGHLRANVVLPAVVALAAIGLRLSNRWAAYPAWALGWLAVCLPFITVNPRVAIDNPHMTNQDAYALMLAWYGEALLNVGLLLLLGRYSFASSGRSSPPSERS